MKAFDGFQNESVQIPGQKDKKISVKHLLIALPTTLLGSIIFYTFGSLLQYNDNSTDNMSDEEIVSMRKQTLDSFSKLQIAARIMPSQNTERNMILMNSKQTDSEFYQQSEESENDFFQLSQTTQYFPQLTITDEYVPVGTAKNFCLHFEWIQKNQRNFLDKYFHVQNLPDCKNAKNEKVHWQKSDPKQGLDFFVWKQSFEQAESCSESNAIYFQQTPEAPGRCYKYEVLDGVCVLLKYVEHPETATFSWDYDGGCFEGGEFVRYKQGQIGQTYTFDNLKIEVHQSLGDLNDRITNTTGVSLSGLFNVLGGLCLIGGLAIGCFLAFVIYNKVRKQEVRNVPHTQQIDDE